MRCSGLHRRSRHNGPSRTRYWSSLLKDYKKPENLLGEDGILQELKKALVEKALGAELTQHLGHEKGERPSNLAGLPVRH